MNNTIKNIKDLKSDDINRKDNYVFITKLQAIGDHLRERSTPRQRKAYQLFGEGKFDECLKTLNTQQIKNDYLQNIQNKEMDKKAAQHQYVLEILTKIDILDGMDFIPGQEKRDKEMNFLYEEIIPMILKEKIELQIIHDYIVFLRYQNDLNRALEISKQLESIYDTLKPLSKDMAALYCLLAEINNDLNCFTETEKYYQKAINLYQNLVNKDPKSYEVYLAFTYRAIGNFYFNQNMRDNALMFYKKTINLYEKFSRKDPYKYGSVLAIVYKKVGEIYADQGKIRKAKLYCRKAANLRTYVKEAVRKINGEIIPIGIVSQDCEES